MQLEKLERPGRTIAYRKLGNGKQLVLLLHGWPQTNLCWREVAPALADKFTVVGPDLRGYGESVAEPDLLFDKRSVSEDLRELMTHLGFDSAYVAGHDRGARVAHRWALDHPDEVQKLALLDILPTREVMASIDARSAKAMWHWLFHAQPNLPELMLKGHVGPYIHHFLDRPAAVGAIDDATMDAYVDAFETSGVHGWLGDYRAGFTTDLELDEADHVNDLRVSPALLVLWGDSGGLAGKDVVGIWQQYAWEVEGRALAGCGHYVPEERPAEVVDALSEFFSRDQ